jgi:hypothetical protein
MNKEAMMKMLTSVSVAVAVLLLSPSAFGCGEDPYQVEIGDGWFRGSFGSARNSCDGVQELRCADFGGYARCGARDSAGTRKMCTTNKQKHISVVRGMDDSSFIYVYFSEGKCTRIMAHTGSQFEPKVK